MSAWTLLTTVFHGAQMVQEFKEKKRFTAEEAKRILLDISESASSGDYI